MKLYRRASDGLLNDMVARQKTDIAVYTRAKTLVYLIHGVTGTPAEMRYLANALARHGCDVYVPTLPGHCRRLRNLADSTEEDWRGHVHDQLTYAKKKYDHVFAAGLSAGGLLALDAAAEMKLDGIGVLSPTFIYDGWNTPWSNHILPFAMKYVPLSIQHLLFHIDGPPFGIKDPTLQAQIRAAYHPWGVFLEWLRACWPVNSTSSPMKLGEEPSSASNGYPIFPLITLTQIDRLIRRVRERLSKVSTPTIVLQAIEDDMTSPENAKIVLNGIVSSRKKIVYLEDCFHVIPVDKQRKAVVAHLSEFFDIPALRNQHSILGNASPLPEAD